MKYALIIDQGTTSTRVIIFDQRGNIIFKLMKEFKQFYPYEGYILHDAEMIYNDVVELVSMALTEVNIDYSDIIGVGITNQRETTVVWDKITNKPIYYAIVWQSNQSKKICDDLIANGYEELIYDKTGLVLNPYFSASKIKWILDNVDNAKELMAEKRLLFGTIDSYLTYRLTGGIHVTDYTNASRTMLFNIHTLSWDDDLLQLFKIDKSMLPKVVSSNAIVGGICEPKIKNICNLEICAIVGDQHASLIGHTCFCEGDVKITYGTGSFMLLNTKDKAIKSNNGLLTTIAYVIDNKPTYALEGSVFVAGSAFQFIRDNLEIVRTLSDEEFTQSDSNGVLFIPSLTGLGAPYWNSYCKGAIFGLTRATTKKDIAIATIEGVALLNYDVLEAMKKDTNLKIQSVSADGGASLNSHLMQFQSNIIQNNIYTLSTSEATSLGAFYLVGLAKGLFKVFDDIKKLNKKNKVYKPKLLTTDIDDKICNWHKAIESLLYFSKK